MNKQIDRPVDFKALGVSYLTTHFMIRRDTKMKLFTTTFQFSKSGVFHDIKSENLSDVYNDVKEYIAKKIKI